MRNILNAHYVEQCSKPIVAACLRSLANSGFALSWLPIEMWRRLSFFSATPRVLSMFESRLVPIANSTFTWSLKWLIQTKSLSPFCK